MDRLCGAMMSSVALVLLFAVLAPNPAIAIECDTNSNHNLTQGYKIGGEHLVITDRVTVSASESTTVSEDWEADRQARQISYIEVIDQYTNGKGGCVVVKKGGLWRKDLSLHFESQVGEGLDFIIKIYVPRYPNDLPDSE